jgi:hypothetical protein
LNMRLTTAAMGIVLCAASMAFAGAAKTYQVTGPVLEVQDDKIVVQKGSEKWEIAKDKDSKVTGDLKVGSKISPSSSEYFYSHNVVGAHQRVSDCVPPPC